MLVISSSNPKTNRDPFHLNNAVDCDYLSPYVLEDRISFEQDRLRAARLILDLSYDSIENGEDSRVIELLRLGAKRILDSASWEVSKPAYDIPEPIPAWQDSHDDDMPSYGKESAKHIGDDECWF